MIVKREYCGQSTESEVFFIFTTNYSFSCIEKVLLHQNDKNEELLQEYSQPHNFPFVICRSEFVRHCQSNSVQEIKSI